MIHRLSLSVMALIALMLSQPGFADAGADVLAAPSAELPRGYAAAALHAPVAFGASWGSVGIAATESETGPNGRDGSMAAAIGLGDPDRWIGADLAVVLSSLSSSEAGPYGFGEEGSFALKLHRNIGNDTAIAMGASSLAPWGGAVFKRNNDPGYYLGTTRAFNLGNSLLMLSGGGARNISNYGHDAISAFAALAYYPTHWFSLIAEYSGYTANAGFSVAPFSRWLPLTFSAGAVDLANQHNQHPKLTTMLSLGYHF